MKLSLLSATTILAVAFAVSPSIIVNSNAVARHGSKHSTNYANARKHVGARQNQHTNHKARSKGKAKAGSKNKSKNKKNAKQTTQLTSASSITGNTLINEAAAVYNNDHAVLSSSRKGQAKASPMTWTAGINPFFQGMTFDDAKVLLGLRNVNSHGLLSSAKSVACTTTIHGKAPPTSFDPRTNASANGKKFLIGDIRNQGKCGSCWAVSAAEVWSDRVSSARGTETELSAQELVSCDTVDQGCGGGQLNTAWDFIQENGLEDQRCYGEYISGQNGTNGECKLDTTKSCGKETPSSITNICTKNFEELVKRELYNNGPVQIGFMVYNSFMTYTSGVYQKEWYEIKPAGGHAVKIVGYGPGYWLIANSWGTKWGLDGYFKITSDLSKNGFMITTTSGAWAGSV